MTGFALLGANQKAPVAELLTRKHQLNSYRVLNREAKLSYASCLQKLNIHPLCERVLRNFYGYQWRCSGRENFQTHSAGRMLLSRVWLPDRRFMEFEGLSGFRVIWNNLQEFDLSDSGYHCIERIPHLVQGGKMAQWLVREFGDRKDCGSNPTSASLLPLSMLGQPGNVPSLVLPSFRPSWGVSGGRSSRVSEKPCVLLEPKLQEVSEIQSFANKSGYSGDSPGTKLICPEASNPNNRTARRLDGCVTCGLRAKRRHVLIGQNTSQSESSIFSLTLLAPPREILARPCGAFSVKLSRCLAAILTEEGTRAGISPGCSTLDEGSRDAEQMNVLYQTASFFSPYDIRDVVIHVLHGALIQQKTVEKVKGQLQPTNWSISREIHTHLQINLVFTRDQTEPLVYDVLQLNVLHTGRLMIQLARYSRYRKNKIGWEANLMLTYHHHPDVPTPPGSYSGSLDSK
ncbi:hypothetical protein T265_06341 [Opisthorchis viverrini]|uniref:Uncharacterized protein n=1 Tax=Opisthorchis viverrini TaxID=6198 RepID=A0A074ZGL5_OPIVI|nr:hypothetical protein T265_06341 [Opisthorchis viverrini]KER26426.1 hypothetical protein T265_06341 [Opisthorchis viverrini]